MAKFLNRLAARTAMERLREAANEGRNWIVTKKLILETEEGDLEIDPAETVEVGATDDGDMAVKGQAAVVVISDEDLASKIADLVVSADELSDVKFVEKPALDAVMDGEKVDDVIDKLADDEDDNVEVAELDVEKKESVEAKFEKFSKNRMSPSKFLVCESIRVDESDQKPLNMATIKMGFVAKESVNDYAKFAARVSELHGSLQPGEREIALTESGKVMGAFDKKANEGFLYTENSFESPEAMDSFDDTPADLMQDYDLDTNDTEAPEVVECALKKYEESAKSGKDYMELVESLSNEKLGLKENVIADIVSTFNDRSMKECVRAFDTKYGKYVAAFKESVDCDNFIASSENEKRFTKRYFA